MKKNWLRDSLDPGILKKISRTMRLTIILIFGFIFTVSASDSYSQAKRMNVQLNNSTITEAFSYIEQNSEFIFLYRENDLDKSKEIEVDLQNANINQILDVVLADQQLNYEIYDRQIVIRKADATDSQASQAQKTIQGVVTDQSGAPLPGVTVVVEGTTIGTITGSDGSFSLDIPEDAEELHVSFVGMVTQIIPVEGKTTFTIAMEEDSIGLEEVVAVGYGVQRKSSLTGAIASVNTEELENRSVQNVGNALQGKISGVQVLAMSGAPGASPEFRVRGYSSTSQSPPLYIVDGLQVDDIAYLDPSSIGSVEVLKDAASAAIYGAQAGNGVVLITTKSGKVGTGRFFYNGLYTTQTQSNKMDMMSGPQFKTFWMEAGQPETAFQGADTDWQDVMYETGVRTTQTIGFEGGNQKGTFYSALTYNKDDGMVVGDDDTYERVALQLNATYQVTPWMKVGSTNSIERAKTVGVSANNFTSSGSVVGGAYFYDPTVPVYYQNDADAPTELGLLEAEAEGYRVDRNSEGQLYGGSLLLQSNLWNPLLMIYNYKNEQWRSNINGTFYGELTPIEGLVFTSRLGYRFGTLARQSYEANFYHNHNQSRRTGRLYNTDVRHNFYYQWENFVNYAFDVGSHDVNAMVGMQYTSDNNQYAGGATQNLDSEAENYRYLDYSAADATDDVFGNNIDRRSISYFSRLDYNYANKYLITASFRADAYDASKLSKDNRWGYFPSVSAGWNISNENFVKNMGFGALSNFKIRGSWGINGNVNVLNGYPYAPSLQLGQNYYSFSNTLVTSAQPSTQLPNPDLTWEKSKQTDVGFDSRFFDGKLSFNMDYFYKVTEGMLGSGPAPVVSGTNTVTINIGKIENRGFEFDLAWRDQLGDFNYSVNANLSTLKNEVIESPYGEGRQSGGGGFLYGGGTYFEAGYPIWYLRGYVIDHLDDQGLPVYKTAEELGTDDGRMEMGKAIPDFTYGITLTAEYKGVDLRIFGQGQEGSSLLWAINRPDLPLQNYPVFMYNDRWTPSNTDATRPSPLVYQVGDVRRYAQSNLWFFDNSYFKIKEIQLGYSLPSRIINPLKITALRAYVSLENFFTFTSYPGNDPESMANTTGGGFFRGGMGVDQVQYPSMKQITFGVNVSF